MVVAFVTLLVAGAVAAAVYRVRSNGAAPDSSQPVEILLGPQDLARLLAPRPAAAPVPAATPATAPVVQPAPAAPPAQPLTAVEVEKRVREIALGELTPGEPGPEHAAVAAAAVAALLDSATLRQLAPRRPSLLPQLIRAANDDAAPRRELAAIIRRDPSLVGTLLTMANSSFYRVTERPVASIDRAVVLLGSDGIRSLIAAATMQPIFRGGGGHFPRFAETAWERAWRSANAAVVHAAMAEKADAFAAELLSLVWALADVVLFRVVLDRYVAGRAGATLRPDPRVIAALLDSHTATVARRIGADWELADDNLAALEQAAAPGEPAAPLGRSLRFGRIVGALAVLRDNKVIDDATARVSLPRCPLAAEQLDRMWARMTPDPGKAADPNKRTTA